MKLPIVLSFIVISQFFCTTLWFATNAVSTEIALVIGRSDSVAVLTSSVQFGFIVGTLIFAILSVADRFSAARVFLVCACLGSLANVSIVFGSSIEWVISFRFLTGFFLAGIYPVGMKIAADYHKEGLGLALGYLVGALVLGTAFPHLIRGFVDADNWRLVVLVSSVLSVVGGLIIGLGVGDGPYRKPLAAFDIRALPRVFRYPKFRSAAFGYFGHMWELYAFWAFVPAYMSLHQHVNSNMSIWNFILIGIGALGCVLGGYLSKGLGSRFVAGGSLSISMICCFLSPMALQLPWIPFVSFLLIWGFFVVSDSPQFSSIVAQAAPAELKGTGLTIVNCIGFAITILSIQLVEWIGMERWTLVVLAIGPMMGLILFRKNQN